MRIPQAISRARIGAKVLPKAPCPAVSAGVQARILLASRCNVTCKASKQDGSGSSVIDRPTIAPNENLKGQTIKQKPPMYRVLLHNDGVNRREYVVTALLKVVDGLTMEDAINVMQQAHINGVALVLVCAQEEAEEYVSGLRNNGLTSTLEPQGGGKKESGDN